MIDICYLHIGAGKTGSTTIQQTFHKNREILLEEGYIYPGDTASHHFLVSRFHQTPGKLLQNQRRNSKEALELFHNTSDEKFRNEIKNTNANTMILSDEAFCTFKPNPVKNLYDYLKPLAKKIVVICYVRHPASLASSFFQHGLKIGGMTFDNLRKPFIFLKQSQYLAAYAETFGKENIIVREFSRKSLRNSDILDDFSEVIGLSRDVLKHIQRVQANESISFEAALIAEKITRFAPKYDKNRGPFKALFDIKGPKYVLPPETVKAVLEQEKEELDYLKNEFSLELKMPEIPKQPSKDELWGDDTLNSLAKIINSQACRIRRLESVSNLRKAEIAILKDQYAEADTCFKLAIMDPSNDDAFFQYSLFLKQRGNNSEAKIMMKTAQKISPDNQKYNLDCFE